MKRIEHDQQRTGTDSRCIEEAAQSLSVSILDVWLTLTSHLSAIARCELDASGKLHMYVEQRQTLAPRPPYRGIIRHVRGRLSQGGATLSRDA